MKSSRVAVAAAWIGLSLFLSGAAIHSPCSDSTDPVCHLLDPAIFQAPGQGTEKSIALPDLPGANYSKKDREKEREFFTVDFHSPQTGLCPKTWSTSPGTIVYDLSEATVSQGEFESQVCKQKGGDDRVGADKIAKFKSSMNADGTSGTYSLSSLLYYHFSRYLDTEVYVPPSIYRELNRQAHLQRVSLAGAAATSRGMIAKGWDHMVAAERNPGSYSPQAHLFTPGSENIYGIMIRGKGERYGPEINGIRSKWGLTSSKDFQDTPAFTALRNGAPIVEAINQTLAGYGTYVAQAKRRKAREGKQLEAAWRAGISQQQMAYWMRELSEIAVLDYIFSQQDRIGNIDYRWYWYWVEDGKVKHKRVKDDDLEDLPRSRMSRIEARVPEELRPFHPVLLQRTQLNDNDAGGLRRYANFTKKSQMVENLRHMSADTYRKLLALDADLRSRGPIYQWLTSNEGLPLGSSDVRQIVKNTQLARDILVRSCKAGQLRFDLEPDQLMTGSVTETRLDCENPSGGTEVSVDVDVSTPPLPEASQYCTSGQTDCLRPISVPRCRVRTGPGTTYDIQPRRAGSGDARILEERELGDQYSPWRHVELPDGREGWLGNVCLD